MKWKQGQLDCFCQEYLKTMSPTQAAKVAGVSDGYAALATAQVERRLEVLRRGVQDQVLRQDAIRRLAELAFGRPNDAIELALAEARPAVSRLDLTAVAECKVSDKGMEVKFIDRIKAIETLCHLLEGGESAPLEALMQVLEGGGDDGEKTPSP